MVLLEALLKDEYEDLYLNDAAFHAFVYQATQMIPIMFDALVDKVAQECRDAPLVRYDGL
jgi:hypothetical protein